jgi:hypothetical protein
VPDTRREELGAVVSRAVPDVSFGGTPDLTSPVVLLGARQAKGLEFDSVLIADPAAILGPDGGDHFAASFRVRLRNRSSRVCSLSRDGYRDMELFIGTVRDSGRADRLEIAPVVCLFRRASAWPGSVLAGRRRLLRPQWPPP